MRPIKSIAFGIALLCALGVVAADPPAEKPPGSEKIFLLPIEIDYDSGAANGNAVISRLIPANLIPVADKWKLFNIAMVVIADAPGGVPGSPGNPDPLPGDGDRVFGLGDFTDAILYSPNKSKGVQWGVGAIFGFPTATDDVLGSGKWTAGPAVRVAHQSRHWHFGLLAGNLRSYAGDSNRADVHQLLVRGLVRRTFQNNWFFIYAPIITANWNAGSGQKWLIPVGGGIGKSLKVKSTRVNVTFQVYGNVVKPDGAPDSVVRVSFVLPFWKPK